MFYGEDDEATMKADKKLWIALNNQQVGLIMTTLARMQLFFSSSDEEYQGSVSQVRNLASHNTVTPQLNRSDIANGFMM